MTIRPREYVLNVFVLLRVLGFVAVFAAVSVPSMASRAPGTLPNAHDELRARALQKEFRCLVCQGESLDDSNAPLAAELRRVVRQRIVAGDSDEQISHYLVARYGDFILMKPPFGPQTYVLWLAPIVTLTLAGAVAMWVVTAARRRAGQP